MNYDFSILKPNRAHIVSGTEIAAATFMLIVACVLLRFDTLGVLIGTIGAIWATIQFVNATGDRAAALSLFVSTNHILPLDSASQNAAVPENLRGIGHSEYVRNGYRFSKDLIWPVDVTEYQYVEGSGRYRQIHDFTVASFRTKKQYPQLYLDGKANGQTGFIYKQGQTIELEGDFNEYFTLYAPKEARSTALAVITPDIMHTLITSGRKFDIEISGNLISVVGKNNYYTEEDLPVLLSFVDVLQKEFSQLDWSWRPVYSSTGEPMNLRRSKMRKVVAGAIIILFFLIYIAVAILPAFMSSR